MRVNRRLVFAAPFVLVVACKKPIADPVEPDKEVGDTEEVVESQPRDAAVVEVAEVAPVPADAAPPRPATECTPPMHCNPPGFVRARIINVRLGGDGTAITTSKGSADGIKTGWRGCVIDSAARCVLGGQFTISAASERTSRAVVKITPDQLKANPDVKLEPP